MYPAIEGVCAKRRRHSCPSAQTLPRSSPAAARRPRGGTSTQSWGSRRRWGTSSSKGGRATRCSWTHSWGASAAPRRRRAARSPRPARARAPRPARARRASFVESLFECGRPLARMRPTRCVARGQVMLCATHHRKAPLCVSRCLAPGWFNQYWCDAAYMNLQEVLGVPVDAGAHERAQGVEQSTRHFRAASDADG